MIIEITAMELQFLEETLESVLEELQGFEEAGDTSDYVFTTGAIDMCKEALMMLKRIAEEVDSADSFVDPGYTDPT